MTAVTSCTSPENFMFPDDTLAQLEFGDERRTRNVSLQVQKSAKPENGCFLRVSMKLHKSTIWKDENFSACTARDGDHFGIIGFENLC